MEEDEALLENRFSNYFREETNMFDAHTSVGVLAVPIPKKSQTGQWIEMLHRHEAKLKEELMIIAELEGVIFDYAKLRRQSDLEAENVKVPVRTRITKTLVKDILSILIIEMKILGKIKRIADLAKGSTAQINEYTDEMMIRTVSKEAEIYFTRIASKRIVLDRRYGFRLEQMKALINLTLSNDHAIVAEAKVALCASTSTEHYNHVIANPTLVLGTAIAEARLTCSEVLTLVFPQVKGSNEFKCVACKTNVRLDSVIYHRQCKVVDWLVRHCQFNYNTAGFLETRIAISLSPRQRARLYQELRLHALLSKDVVVNGPGGYVVWSRNQQGKLQRRVVDSRDDSQIVGTREWLVKHGYVQRN